VLRGWFLRAAASESSQASSPEFKTTLCGRAASARASGSESSKANAGTTDMAGSLRAVIAPPVQCCSAEAGAEWLAMQGVDGAVLFSGQA